MTPSPRLPEPEIIQIKKHSFVSKLRIRHHVWRSIRNAEFGKPALDRFRSGVIGELPTRAASGTIVAACNDLYYWRFTVTLLLSIEKLRQKEHVHLHLCDPSPETIAHIRQVAESLEHVSLTWTTDACVLAEDLSYKSIYFAAVRFLIAREVMAATRMPVLCLDVDSVAVKPIWPYYEDHRAPGDTSLIRRLGKTSSVNRILASAAGFDPTVAGSRFLDCAARTLASLFPVKPIYHIDQIVLAFLSEALVRRNGLSVAAMPTGLSDHEFTPDAAVWTAKSWKTKNSDLYLDVKTTIDAEFPRLAVSITA